MLNHKNKQIEEKNEFIEKQNEALTLMREFTSSNVGKYG